MFYVGQEVGFLREKGKATVLEIVGKKARIEDSDGFDRWVGLNELIQLHGTSFEIHTDLVNPEAEKGVIKSRLERKRETSKQHQGQIEWELDLHIEELVESLSGLSSTDMLLRQMATLKARFRKAKDHRVNKLIVIHGVGEGVLKNEIRSFLAKQEQIEFFDADFSKYGSGATEVVFHPNW